MAHTTTESDRNQNSNARPNPQDETNRVRTTEKFVPEQLLLNLKIGKGTAKELRNAGLDASYQTREQERRKRERQETEARSIGRDAFRGGRTDKKGEKIPDSGTPVFGWKPEGRQSLVLNRVLADIAMMGLVLEDAFILDKEGGKTYLRLKFRKGSNDPLDLPTSIWAVVNKLLERGQWQYCHCYRNPDKSVTVNTVNWSEGVPEEDSRSLRLRKDGAIETVPHTA